MKIKQLILLVGAPVTASSIGVAMVGTVAHQLMVVPLYVLFGLIVGRLTA